MRDRTAYVGAMGAYYFPLLDTEYRSGVEEDLLHAAAARGIQTRHWRARLRERSCRHNRKHAQRLR